MITIRPTKVVTKHLKFMTAFFMFLDLLFGLGATGKKWSKICYLFCLEDLLIYTNYGFVVLKNIRISTMTNE